MFSFFFKQRICSTTLLENNISLQQRPYDFLKVKKQHRDSHERTYNDNNNNNKKIFMRLWYKTIKKTPDVQSCKVTDISKALMSWAEFWLKLFVQVWFKTVILTVILKSINKLFHFVFYDIVCTILWTFMRVILTLCYRP